MNKRDHKVLRIIFYIFFAIFTVVVFGCSSFQEEKEHRVRVEYSYNTSWAMGGVLNDVKTGVRVSGSGIESNAEFDAHILGIKYGRRYQIKDTFSAIDLFIGPTVIFPHNVEGGGNSDFIGVEIAPRLIYTKWRVQPYFQLGLGVGTYLGHPWKGQGTYINSLVSGGFGIVVQDVFSRNLDLVVGFGEWTHISNGSALFQHDILNRAFNTDSVIKLGLEFKF